ncbi:tetratricopeptide repeat protein [Psychrobium sp. nBUS_13]|uniref:tetratricopeptide repeat protein n=1 Tax=Psychrobium sp. nBUS_13 TaxID=3395319 RepID=UPI003EBAC85C
MSLKSLQFLSKSILSILLLSYSISVAATDAVTNRLLFAEQLPEVKKYRSMDKSQKEQWFNQHQKDIENASVHNLLVASGYLYHTSQYELAKQNIDLLIKKLSSDIKPIVAANAWFLHSMNTAIGLDQFDDAVAIFEQTITRLSQSDESKKDQDFLKLSVVANYRLGSLLLFLKQPDDAKEYLKNSIAQAKKSDDRSYLVTPTLELAKYYIAKSDPANAEQQLIESYDIALATESSRRPDILHQLSRYYRKNKRYDLAIDYATRSLRYRETQADQLTHLPSAYNNLAIAYEESGDLNSALVHYLNAIKILEGKTGYHYLAIATHNSGLIYQKQGKVELALEYLLKANKHFKAMGHGYFLMSNHLRLAEVYFSQQSYQSTIKYGELALAAATKHKQADAEYQTLEYLAKSHLALKNHEKSAQYFSRYSTIQMQKNDELTSKLAKKNTSFVSDNADLKANLYDTKSLLNEQQLMTAQQTRSISNMTQWLYALSALIVICFVIYLRTKRQSSIVQQQNDIDKATQLVYLHNESLLLKTVNNQFIQHTNVFALKLPILTHLLDVMDVDRAQAFRIHLIRQLSNFIEQPLYKLSEDTFVFAKTPSDTQQVGQRFTLLIKHYQSLIPDELNELATQNTIMLGCIKQQATDKPVNLIQAKNMINLALTALSAVKQHQSWETTNNWLMLTEKENSTTAMFTCPTRREWLQLVNNRVLTVNTGIVQDINWQSIPYYDQ